MLEKMDSSQRLIIIRSKLTKINIKTAKLKKIHKNPGNLKLRS